MIKLCSISSCEERKVKMSSPPPPPPPGPPSLGKQVLYEEKGVQLTSQGIELPPRKFAAATASPVQDAKKEIALQAFSDATSKDDADFFIYVRSVEDVKRAMQAWGVEHVAEMVKKLLQDKSLTSIERQRVKLMWTDEIDKAFEKEIVINALLPRLFFDQSDNALCVDLFQVKERLMNVSTSLKTEEKKEQDIDDLVDAYLDLREELEQPVKMLREEVPNKLEAMVTQYTLPPGVKKATLALIQTLRTTTIPGVSEGMVVTKLQAAREAWGKTFFPLAQAIANEEERQRVSPDFERAIVRESKLPIKPNSAQVEKKRASAEQRLQDVLSTAISSGNAADIKPMLEKMTEDNAFATRKEIKSLLGVADKETARERAFVEIGKNLTPLQLNVLQLIVDKDVFQTLTNALADAAPAGVQKQLYFALGAKEKGAIKIKVGFPEGMVPQRPDASFFQGNTCNGKSYDEMIDEINIEETRKREEEARKARAKALQSEIDAIVEPIAKEKKTIESAIVVVRRSNLPPEKSEPVIGELSRKLRALQNRMRQQLCKMIEDQLSSPSATAQDKARLLAMLENALGKMGDTQTFSQDDTIETLRQKICPSTTAAEDDDDKRSSAATPVQNTADAVIQQVAAEERVEDAENAVVAQEARVADVTQSQNQAKRVAFAVLAAAGGGGAGAGAAGAAAASREKLQGYAEQLEALRVEKTDADTALGEAQSQLSQARADAVAAKQTADETIAALQERVKVAETKVETMTSERVDQYRAICNINVAELQSMLDNNQLDDLNKSVTTYLLLFSPDDAKNIPERLVDKIDRLSGLCKGLRASSKTVPLEPDNVMEFKQKVQDWYTPAFQTSCADAVERGDLPEIMDRIRTLEKKMSPEEFVVEPGPLSLDDARTELKDMCTTMNELLAEPQDKVVNRLDTTLRDKRPFWQQVRKRDIAAAAGVVTAAALGGGAMGDAEDGGAGGMDAALQRGTIPEATAMVALESPLASELALIAPNAMNALQKLDQLEQEEKRGELSPELLAADLRIMNDEIVEKISQLEAVGQEIDAERARVTDKDYINADPIAAATNLVNLNNAKAKVDDSLENVRFVGGKLQQLLKDATETSQSWGGWVQSIVESGTGTAPGSLRVIREQLPNAMYGAQAALLAAAALNPAATVAGGAAATVANVATHPMVLRSMVGQSL